MGYRGCKGNGQSKDDQVDQAGYTFATLFCLTNPAEEIKSPRTKIMKAPVRFK